jgi:putative transcriptional regulator
LTIHHHLDDATILAYAAGTLDEALSAVAASHVTWCPQCRDAVRKAEAMGGAFFRDIDGSPVSDDCRSRTMALLDQATLHRFPNPPRIASDMPEPLSRLLGGMRIADIPWRTKVPGVAMYDIKLSSAAKGHLWMMRIAPGKAMPEHGHGGEELTMILSGAYADEIGHFARGDVADLDEDIEHRPVVDADCPCICLVATEAPTRFKSVFARMMQPLVGI